MADFLTRNVHIHGQKYNRTDEQNDTHTRHQYIISRAHAGSAADNKHEAQCVCSTTGSSQLPNSTIRTPATDMYNTTNVRPHNNSATCCTTNSPPTDKNLPHPNILTCRDIGLWHCDVAIFCPLVVLYNISVAGVRVVEFGTK